MSTQPINLTQFGYGLLQYVEDPLHPGTFIAQNDPRYAVIMAWISTQRQDTILRNNALAQFNQAMSNWQQQAAQADDYHLTRPPLPMIPTIEVDTVVDTGGSRYVIHTEFDPVAAYPNPLMPVVVGVPSGSLSQLGGTTANTMQNQINVLQQQLAQAMAMLTQLLAAKLPPTPAPAPTTT